MACFIAYNFCVKFVFFLHQPRGRPRKIFYPFSSQQYYSTIVKVIEVGISNAMIVLNEAKLSTSNAATPLKSQENTLNAGQLISISSLYVKYAEIAGQKN